LDDIRVGGGLFATYVTSTVASAVIKSINPAKALASRGVVTFISAATVKADGYCNFVGYLQLQLFPFYLHFLYGNGSNNK
jgi:CO/xanthine dehydrogenase Mo-binding subunit